MVNAKPFQASFFYKWCTYCYITISQFWTYRGQIHGGSSLSKFRSCMKLTHVRWNHCQNVHRLCLLYCHMLPLPSTRCLLRYYYRTYSYFRSIYLRL